MELRRHMTRIAPLPTQELLKPSNVQVPVLGRCVEAGGCRRGGGGLRTSAEWLTVRAVKDVSWDFTTFAERFE